jgi:hypothetical protein
MGPLENRLRGALLQRQDDAALTGFAEAAVRVEGAQEGERLPPGEILVTTTTNVGMKYTHNEQQRCRNRCFVVKHVASIKGASDATGGDP